MPCVACAIPTGPLLQPGLLQTGLLQTGWGFSSGVDGDDWSDTCDLGAVVTAGVIFVMMGAILTFAVNDDVSWINLRVLGIIVMLGGGALIYHGNQNRNKVREVTTIDDLTEPDRPKHVVREQTMEDDPYEGPAQDHHSRS